MGYWVKAMMAEEGKERRAVRKARSNQLSAREEHSANEGQWLWVELTWMGTSSTI